MTSGTLASIACSATLVSLEIVLTAVPDIGGRRFDTLRMIHYGGTPIAEPTLRRAMATFRCAFAQGYGMTEAACAISFLLPATIGARSAASRSCSSRPGALLLRDCLASVEVAAARERWRARGAGLSG
jgi:acyl-CoA synthetase (AMP-forming)/AMP-acid ligase II